MPLRATSIRVVGDYSARKVVYAEIEGDGNRFWHLGDAVHSHMRPEGQGWRFTFSEYAFACLQPPEPTPEPIEAATHEAIMVELSLMFEKETSDA